MKNIILAFTILFVYTACETGTKYEKNTTIENIKEDSSIRDLVEGSSSAKALVEKSYIEESDTIARKYDPENPLNGDTFSEDSTNENNSEYIAKNTETKEPSFRGGKVTDGLNIKSIRVGYHDTYTRLVFDVEQNGEKVKKVGAYNVNYNAQQGIASVTLNGYRGFSAKFPTFSSKSLIEKIYFEEYQDDSGFKFSIKLRNSATVKAYDYENPARLIIDIRPF